jgi:hypothetical protein
MKLSKQMIGKVKIFTLNFLCVLMSYCLMLHQTYKSDHIVAAVDKSLGNTLTFAQTASNNISAGRPLNIIFNLINRFFGLFSVDKNHNQYVLHIFVFILLAIITVELYQMFSELFNLQGFSLMLDMIILIGFINPVFLEVITWMGYEHAIAILLSGVVSVRLFLNKHYVWTFISLWAAISIYQSYYAPFLIYLFAYIFIANKCRNNRSVLKLYFKGLLIDALAIITNLMSVKIFTAIMHTQEVKKTSLFSGIDVSEKWSNICRWIGIVIGQTYGMMPALFVIVILVVLVLLVIYYDRKKEGFLQFMVSFLILSTIMMLIPIAFIIVVPGASYLAPREVTSFFMAVSMSIMILYYYLYDSESFRAGKKKFMAVVGIFCAVDLFCVETVELDLFISTALDISEVRQIDAIIQKYEDDNDIKVTNIAARVMDGDRGQWTYDYYYHMNYLSDTFISKITHVGWCNVELIDYISENYYNEIEMTDDEYSEYFGNLKDDDIFNPQTQLVFKGDTLYWAIE